MLIGNIWYGGGGHIWKQPITKPIKDPDDVIRCDMVVLHGGEDISPSLYGQKAVHSFVGDDPSKRDKVEVACIKKAIEKGIPLFGICRGAQLLNAIAGGTLFQHVDGHTGGHHELMTSTGEVFYTNSAHHQMMILPDEGVLLAKTPYKIAKSRWMDDETSSISALPEVEAAFWPSINAVGIQGHPEWVGEHTLLVKYCRHIVREYLRVHVGV